jgi:hypothetical protein
VRSHALFLIIFALVFSLFFWPTQAAAHPPAKGEFGQKKFEVEFFGGLSGSRVLGPTHYQDSWSSFLLDNITEQTAIESRAKNGLGLGATITYFMTPNFGFKLLAGFARADLTSMASFDFGWIWSDGSSGQKKIDWSGAGGLTSIPVSLDLAAKAGFGRLEAEFAGGVTYFRNTLNADSIFGYGVTKIFTTYVAPDWVAGQYLDALPVGLRIQDRTWSALGANIGGSLNFKLTKTIGLGAAARYFYCPRKNLNWDFVFGTYDGVFFEDIKDEPFTDNDAAYLVQNNHTFDLKVNPSFFQVSLGIVFSFGRKI